MKRIFQILALVSVLVMADFSAARGETPPESAFISGFVGHAQSYAIDCEVRSAVDWAGFWGVSIGETEFLNALPRTDNPDAGFVGDPNEPWGRIPPDGYGVHADPIAKTLQDFGLQAEAHRDLSWEELKQEIDAGHPVIVWVIGAMWEGSPVEYKASDGHTSRVAAYEHTMTLVGYTSETVKVVDASSGHLDTYWLNDFLNSWAVLSNMAVIGSYEPAPVEDPLSPATDQSTVPYTSQDLGGKALQNSVQSAAQAAALEIAPTDQLSAPDAALGANVESYTVQTGDYVMKIARRFGVGWLELAQLNSLSYPYIIYSGQELKLPVHEAVPPEAVQNPPASTGNQLNFHAYLPMMQRGRVGQLIAVVEKPGGMALLSHAEAAAPVHSQESAWQDLPFDWRQLARVNSLRMSYLSFRVIW
jgi:uncharacterized protein YvpB/LysM repeat protein